MVHNDYSSQNLVNIRMWADKVAETDYGGISEGWMIEDLHSEHVSRSPNPTLARAFFAMGYVEGWGRGIQRIMDGYRNTDRVPEIKADRNYFLVTLPSTIRRKDDLAAMLAAFRDQEIGFSDFASIFDERNRSNKARRALGELMENGLVEMTIPDKPRSRDQMYRLIDEGRKAAHRRRCVQAHERLSRSDPTH